MCSSGSGDHFCLCCWTWLLFCWEAVYGWGESSLCCEENDLCHGVPIANFCWSGIYPAIVIKETAISLGTGLKARALSSLKPSSFKNIMRCAGVACWWLSVLLPTLWLNMQDNLETPFWQPVTMGAAGPRQGDVQRGETSHLARLRATAADY